MIDEVGEYWTDDDGSAQPQEQRTIEPRTKGVFVIHGRDEGTRDTVAKFLQQLGLEPTILNEKASQGLTVIEKFEKHAAVSFAIALLTPDDAGALSSKTDTLQPRARQKRDLRAGLLYRTPGTSRRLRAYQR